MANNGRAYRLISSDGHLNEPADIWTSRVAAKNRDRVPRVESLEQGDAWVFPGFESVVPFSYGACAGRDPKTMGPWCRYADINPGSYDPKARLSELDEDGVDAELVFGSNYPSAFVSTCEDKDLHHDMVRAYNDFMSEFCATDATRLGGTALLPNRGAKECLAEIERVSKMPGFVAFLLKRYPNGGLSILPEDDAVWEAIEASGKPVAIHVGLTTQMMGMARAETLPGTGHFHDAPLRMLQFIFGGVLDRFPKLRIPLIEVDCGWIPYFEDQADDNYMRHSKASLKDRKPPSSTTLSRSITGIGSGSSGCCGLATIRTSPPTGRSLGKPSTRSSAKCPPMKDTRFWPAMPSSSSSSIKFRADGALCRGQNARQDEMCVGHSLYSSDRGPAACPGSRCAGRAPGIQ
jgi:predicted TIM-barrel fold metal-dependent hydrolase